MYQFRHLFQVMAVWAILYNILRLFIYNKYTIILGLAILAYKLSDIIMKIIWHFSPRSMLPRLQDKAVLITGCDTGFGNMLARELDAKGVTVFAGCLLPHGAAALELKRDCSDRLKVLQLDVTQDDHVKAAVKSVTDYLGDKSLIAIVNNAGTHFTSEAEIVPIEAAAKLFDVNVLGVIRVTQAFLPFIRRSKGRVVFIGSLTVYSTPIINTTYTMSKAAVKSYAEGLRREMLKWSVTVHIVEPIGYKTQMSDIQVNFKKFRDNWNEAPKQIRAEYGGDKYYECFTNQISIAKYLRRPENKIHEVLDCIMDASIGENPKAQYFTGVIGEIVGWIVMNTRSEIFDIINHYFHPRTIREIAARRLD